MGDGGWDCYVESNVIYNVIYIILYKYFVVE
jgi:hypothetical protein